MYKYLFMSLLSNNLGHIPTCGIVVSYGHSIFNLRTCHIVFHSSWAILFSHQQCTGVQISLHPRQHFFPFLKKNLFYSHHPNGCEVIFHCGFDLHFPNASDVEHLFLCLLTIYTSSGDVSFQASEHSLFISFNL